MAAGLPGAATLPNLGVQISPAWFKAAPLALNDGAPLPFFPGVALCTPASSLALQLTVPPYVVSRGNTNGDVYTVTVTNNGAVSTTEVSLLIAPGTGFYYLGNSALVESNISGTLSSTDTGTGAPGATASITVIGDEAANALQPGETMTFTFRLATNADAESGQLLKVSLQSGSPTPTACKTTQENVTTGRGNLVVTKDTLLVSGAFGETIVWTVTLRNNGFGIVYGARLTDTIGAGFATGYSVTPNPANPIDLVRNATQEYIVSGTIASCTNLTNTVQASWSIGNADATGTSTNPVRDAADVIFRLEEPVVKVEIEPLKPISYCGSFEARVSITLTNEGGAARNLRLEVTAQNLNVSAPSAGWVLSGDTLTYVAGTPVTGTLLANKTITLSLLVTSTTACASGTASISLRPVYRDACLLLQTSNTAGTTSNSMGAGAPSLSLAKSGPTVVNVGQEFTYTLTASGNSGTGSAAITGITVTDALADFIQVNGLTPSSGSALTNAANVTWTLMPPAGLFTATLAITGTIPPNQASCGVGQSYVNTANARASVGCPDCPVTATVTANPIYIQDTLSPSNTLTMDGTPIDPPRPGPSMSPQR